jgi:hypothetical protein
LNNERSKRFDDVYKMLLLIESVLISSSFAFFKDVMPWEFFNFTILSYIFSIILWCIPHLYATSSEYVFKIIGWYFTVQITLVTFARLCLLVYVLPQIYTISVLTLSFCFSFPMIYYLKQNIGREYVKHLKISLLIVVLALIIWDLMAPF